MNLHGLLKKNFYGKSTLDVDILLLDPLSTSSCLSDLKGLVIFISWAYISNS